MTDVRRRLRSGAVPSADPNADRNPAARRSWDDATPMVRDEAEAWRQVMGNRRRVERGDAEPTARRPKRSTFL